VKQYTQRRDRGEARIKRRGALAADPVVDRFSDSEGGGAPPFS
jgi:hypothetical protein